MAHEDYAMMRPSDEHSESSPMTNDPGPKQPPAGKMDPHTSETEVPLTGMFCEEATKPVKREDYGHQMHGVDPAARY